jgi:hypothetical protein
VEVLRPTPQEAERIRIAHELDRLEAAVAAGNTDLRALGFWRLIAEVERDRVLTISFADRCGRIDDGAFRARIRFRPPVWVGNALLFGVVGAGVVAIVLAARWTGPAAGFALLGAGLAWSLGVHSPTHYVVGRVDGIRFTAYFLGGPPPPRPGIKTDYATYLRADPSKRAWFHASGAIATKIAPFAAVAMAPATNAPGWAVIAMGAYGLLQILTDIVFSVRSSDWKRFLRERAIARELRSR